MESIICEQDFVEIRRKTPDFINLLVYLEYRRLTGYPAARANRKIEKIWSNDLAARLNRCVEKPSVQHAYTLRNYISFLQASETRVKHFPAEFEECIADLVKDYLLTSDEIEEYKKYVNERWASR